jgi:hypothetical protein
VVGLKISVLYVRLTYVEPDAASAAGRVLREVVVGMQISLGGDEIRGNIANT